MLRVCLIIDDLDPGGAQHQLLELARRLPRKRVQCRVVSLSVSRRQLAERFEQAGIPVESIAQAGRWSWTCFFALCRALRAFKPHVAHTWLFTADLYGRLAARLVGVPVVISSVRSVETWKPRHHVWTDRLLQHVTDLITVNAEAIRPILVERERIRPQKLRTIYNGVDLEAFPFQAMNGAARRSLGLGADPVVGIMGRLMPEKDHRTFLQAAARVGARVPGARFLIVGDGPLRQELLEEARRLGLEGRVTLAGFRADRAAMLGAMDVVVSSSHYEGCANAILEAMAMAKPVVATDVGGNRELIVHGRTGVLVPRGDAEAMAEAIRSLLAHPERVSAMGGAGRARVEQRFTVERMVAQTADLYEALVKRGRRGATPDVPGRSMP